MTYYMEEKHFVSRGRGFVSLEDKDLRIDRKEISSAAYYLFIDEILSDVESKFLNSDGSTTYSVINNSNESTEYTFWVEE